MRAARTAPNRPLWQCMLMFIGGGNAFQHHQQLSPGQVDMAAPSDPRVLLSSDAEAIGAVRLGRCRPRYAQCVQPCRKHMHFQSRLHCC